MKLHICSEQIYANADEAIVFPDAQHERHPRDDGQDAADIYASLRTQRDRVFLARCEAEAREHINRTWHTGDKTALSPLVAADAALGVRGRCPSRLIWIGQGTNTWKSDLNLAIRYRRTTGPADAPGATLGIPWMAGIPGTIGGWIKMNAGAFGHSISEVLEAVCIDGVWHRAEDCGFGYRQSSIEGEIQDYRLKPEFRGQRSEVKGQRVEVEGQRAEDYLKRRKKFPAGTYGSFFKNPVGDYAGRLLEAAGAKALRVGGAYVWEEHANVIVRGKDATPSDVLALARLMMARVHAAFGIWLEPEVRGVFPN